MYPTYVLLVSTSPKFHSISFYDQPFFEIQPILRQLHGMTPKWPWILQGQMYPICVTSTHESQISLRFALRPAIFEIQAIFETNAPNDTKMTLNHTRSNVHMCVTVSPSPKFQSVLLYHQPFLRYKPFWEKCTEWPQNDLEHYKVKDTP